MHARTHGRAGGKRRRQARLQGGLINGVRVYTQSRDANASVQHADRSVGGKRRLAELTLAVCALLAALSAHYQLLWPPGNMPQALRPPQSPRAGRCAQLRLPGYCKHGLNLEHGQG